MEQIICGRPTFRGKPCRIKTYPPACGYHMTPEEAAEQKKAITVLVAKQNLLLLGLTPEHAWSGGRHRPWWPIEVWRPACHQWPAPQPGMTVFEWQDSWCAICGCNGAPVEDHCHRTGLFRGYLCTGCNTREGRSDADPIVLYRERPPAVIVGETWQYFGGWGNRNGAQPEPWVVDALGPVPSDQSQAVAYLAAAAQLKPPQLWDFPALF